MLPTEDIEPRIPLTFNPFEERPLLDAYRQALSPGDRRVRGPNAKPQHEARDFHGEWNYTISPG